MTHTNICTDGINAPFLTLIEDDRMLNTFYHNDYDYLWYLTSEGFRIIKNGSKKKLLNFKMILNNETSKRKCSN